MKLIVVLASVLVLAVVSWWFGRLWEVRSTPPTVGSGRPGEEPALERRIRALEAAVDRIGRTPAAGLVPDAPRVTRTPQHGSEHPFEPIPSPFGDPGASLQAWVLSYESGLGGSELYRLIVDAHVLELLDELGPLLVDRQSHPGLRRAIVAMLDHPRSRQRPGIAELLVEALAVGPGATLRQAVIAALRNVGGADVAMPLERILPRLEDESLRLAAIETLLHLLGGDSNHALLRLLHGERSEKICAALLARIRGDGDDALRVFRHASSLGQPLRLVAAHQLARHRATPFRSFAQEWHGFERDAAVRAVLDATIGSQNTIRDYDAMKLTGPADARPASGDHRNAWCPAQPDSGAEWIELHYDTPLRAHQVRIFEVYTGGAVAEVSVRVGGRWQSVWRGVDPLEEAGVFEVDFGLTSAPVDGIRVQLDTSRRQGWHEFDAVELVGPGGRAWASSATTSSTWGHRSAGIDHDDLEALEGYLGR